MTKKTPVQRAKSIQDTYKSIDTEEWLDLHFTRPIGYFWACLFARWGVHPNTITVLSIFLGVGAAVCFYFTDFRVNLLGVALLMWANFYDSADGQLARMTHQKTRLGRMLDGFAGDVWFYAIYLALCFRLLTQPIPFIGSPWGIWIFVFAAVSGWGFHAVQCQLADYYRNIHLFFLKGETDSELDTEAEQRHILEETPRQGNFWWRAFLWGYANYVRAQERKTPAFQALIRAVRQRGFAHLSPDFRRDFLAGSRPLMKYANILTFNCRALTLYVVCLMDIPCVYFCVEMTVFAALSAYMHTRHELLCRRCLLSLNSESRHEGAFLTSEMPCTGRSRGNWKGLRRLEKRDAASGKNGMLHIVYVICCISSRSYAAYHLGHMLHPIFTTSADRFRRLCILWKKRVLSDCNFNYRHLFLGAGLIAVVLMLLTFDVPFVKVGSLLRRAGVWFPAVIGIWVVIYFFNTWSWAYLLPKNVRKSPLFFAWLYKLSVSGFALNYATPFGLMGGEPYRILELTPYVGGNRATSSVILYVMMHILSHVCFWLLSACLYLGFYPVTTWSFCFSLLTITVLIVILYFFIKGYQHGMVVRLLASLRHLPYIKRWATSFYERKQEDLRRIDSQIADLHRQHKPSFYKSFLLEFTARLLTCVEIFFILKVFMPDVSLLSCILIMAFTSLVGNLFFFSPMQLGAREGGFVVIMTTLSMPAAVGVYTGLFTRLRELIWIVIGLLLIRTGNRKKV